jgi:hypothetical protein
MSSWAGKSRKTSSLMVPNIVARSNALRGFRLGKRKIEPVERARESCRYRPDPSVIMTNQVIAGLMVDTFRALLNGKTPENIFYDSESDEMFLAA